MEDGAIKSDLQKCLAIGIRQLQEHPSVSSKQVDEIVASFEWSFRNPAERAAKYLVVGERGAGKRALVQSVVDRLRTRSGGSENKLPKFTEVTLNGLLHALNPTTLKRAIAQSLAAVLGSEIDASAKISECHALISAAVAQIKGRGEGVLFVMSDFEFFAPAGSSHSLLYQIANLLEDTGLRSGFIGMTTHQDVLDGLEKRLKSRFQPTEIVVSGFPPGCSQLEDVLSFLTRRLMVEMPGGDSPKEETQMPSSESVRLFNQGVNGLLANESFKSALQRQFARDCTLMRLSFALEEALRVLVGDMNCSGVNRRRKAARANDVELRAVKCFCASLGFPFSGTSDVLCGLSRLEMTVLVACKLRIDRAGSESSPVLFRDVFEEYSLLRGGRTGSVIGGAESREEILDIAVAEKAWGRLVEQALIVQSTSGPCASRASWLGIHGSDVLRALDSHPEMSVELQRWGKRMFS